MSECLTQRGKVRYICREDTEFELELHELDTSQNCSAGRLWRTTTYRVMSCVFVGFCVFSFFYTQFSGNLVCLAGVNASILPVALPHPEIGTEGATGGDL